MRKKLLLVVIVSVLSFGLAYSAECGICEGTGQNYYPVLNEISISPDGTIASLEIINCKSEPWAIKIKPFDKDEDHFDWDYISMYTINYGINVLQQIPIANRLIIIRTPVFEENDHYLQYRNTALIAAIAIPQNNDPTQSYQRIPDIIGPFVWATQNLGYPNNQSIA